MIYHNDNNNKQNDYLKTENKRQALSIKRSVCSLTDSFIYRIDLTNFSYFPSAEFQSLNQDEMMNCIITFYLPTYDEDVYSLTRRNGSFNEFLEDGLRMTSTTGRHPFRYFQQCKLKHVVGKEKVDLRVASLLTLIRPEFVNSFAILIAHEKFTRITPQCMIPVFPNIRPENFGSRNRLQEKLEINRKQVISGGKHYGHISCEISISQFYLEVN